MSHIESLKKQAAALEAKMAAQAAKQKAKLDRIQECLRTAEQREATVQRWKERWMLEEVKKVIARHQKGGLRADYRLVKGPFAGAEVLDAAGIAAAPVLVDAKAEGAAAPAPKPRTEWQKWALDTVHPILKTCDLYHGINHFAVAQRLRAAGHMARVLYEGGVLEKATVQAAVDALRAEAREAREARVALWAAADAVGGGGAARWAAADGAV